MVRPAQSPDLKPIEHLWSELKKRLCKYPEPPTPIHELWTRVEETRDNTEPAACRNLIESMPRRVEVVLKAKRGWATQSTRS